MRFPVRPLPANPSRVMALHHAGGGLRQQAPARASRPPIRSAGAPAGPRPKFSLAAPPARLAERRQRPRGRALPGALGARELGHVLAINSSVFLVGYKALSSGLSNVGIAHAWFLGTVCLAAFQVQGYVLVCAYFVFGTLATKVGKKVKIAEGTYERNEGKRTPASVWGSGFAAAACALAALAFHGDGALCTTLRTGFVASFATKLSDTVASEIGKAYGRTTILITSLKPVPRGTDGAVSLEGTFAGLAASAVYSVLAWRLGQVDPTGAAVCVCAAFVATNLESLLGATLQRDYARVLNNDVVNIIMISAGAAVAMGIKLALGS